MARVWEIVPRTCVFVVAIAAGCSTDAPEQRDPQGFASDTGEPGVATAWQGASASTATSTPADTSEADSATAVGESTSGPVGTDGTVGTDGPVGTGPATTAAPGSTGLGIDATKRVFVSSSTFSATQVANADVHCQALADGAALGGSWVAWVSDATMDAVDKLTPDAGPYVLVDAAATIIATDNVDLTDATLGAPIDIVETGDPYEQTTAVFTGTGANGQAAAATCLDWTIATNAQTGFRGSVTLSGQGWTQIASFGCNGVARIYCFEL